MRRYMVRGCVGCAGGLSAELLLSCVVTEVRVRQCSDVRTSGAQPSSPPSVIWPHCCSSPLLVYGCMYYLYVSSPQPSSGTILGVTCSSQAMMESWWPGDLSRGSGYNRWGGWVLVPVPPTPTEAGHWAGAGMIQARD